MSEIDPETPPLAPDAVPAQPPILAKIAEPAARHLAHTTAPTAADYARRALAPSTIKRYAADWDDFLGFCRATGRQALPAAASTVADYLASLARSHSRSALRRRLSAIAQAHRRTGAQAEKMDNETPGPDAVQHPGCLIVAAFYPSTPC